MRTIFFAQVAIILIVGVGWVLNIIDLVALGFDQFLTIEAVLRIIGIPLAPLGAVMGYFV